MVVKRKALFGFIIVSCLWASMALAAGRKNGGLQEKNAVVYEQRMSQVSNHQFYLTNYGIIGYNTTAATAGWFWPRNSNRAYIYGQGVWFGTRKVVGVDTLKLVSVGYNPNSGAGWFAPGSIDEGLDALPDTDPRAAKYYMYMGTDFSPAGAHLKNPSLADWPIRWVNQSKIPGKNGYYGDYVSDPTLRKNYSPVYITQEDMFSIYKDSDVKRNPEYKPNTGYPISVDILQSVYSWNFGAYQDIVYLSYTVINKSG